MQGLPVSLAAPSLPILPVASQGDMMAGMGDGAWQSVLPLTAGMLTADTDSIELVAPLPGVPAVAALHPDSGDDGRTMPRGQLRQP